MKKKALLALVAIASLLPACEMSVWTQGEEFGGPDELCLNVHATNPCPAQDPDGLAE